VLTCETCGKPFEPVPGGGTLAAGTAAIRCPECAAKDLGLPGRPTSSLTPTAAPGTQKTSRSRTNQFAVELNRVAPGRPVLTYVLIAICTAVFVLELKMGAGFDTMSADLASKLGANYGPLTLTGQWWRLLTAMFLHFGFFHLLMNMFCLWALGSLAERLMGRAAFLLLYFATGVAGGLLSVAVHPQLVSAGASGAVFGLAGGLITYLALKKAPIDFSIAKKELTSLGLFVGYNFIYSLKPGIDIMAHLGGVLSGLVLAAALPVFLQSPDAQLTPAPIHEKSSVNPRIAKIGAICALAAVIAAIGARGMHIDSIRDSNFVLDSLAQIDAGKSADVIPRLEQIVKKQPDSYLAHVALGTAYFHTNKSAQAVPELSQAETLNPDNDFTKQELGASYLDQSDYENALPRFQKVVTDDPKNIQAHLGLAASLLGTHDYQLAATEARTVIAALPKEAEGHAVLGQAEIRLNLVDDGIHEMETAVQLAPDDQDLRTRLLAAYMATGRSANSPDSKFRSGAPAAPSAAH
jgi:membrane associated rhomboid family serine protease/cytochrome c-type biogenesis protein CcmH/NrfG/DNA-directed RNA polymerase subunit RPC12/RpoP